MVTESFVTERLNVSMQRSRIPQNASTKGTLHSRLLAKNLEGQYYFDRKGWGGGGGGGVHRPLVLQGIAGAS